MIAGAKERAPAAAMALIEQLKPISSQSHHRFGRACRWPIVAARTYLSPCVPNPIYVGKPPTELFDAMTMTDPLHTAEIAPARHHPAPAGFVEKAPLERFVSPQKPSLVGLSRAALAQALGPIGVPCAQRKMRVAQLWHWLYVRGARHFAEMTSVSKELHALLDAHFTLARPEVAAEIQSAIDGTRKWLLRLPGEHAERGRTRSNASISRSQTAARSVSPARSAAR